DPLRGVRDEPEPAHDERSLPPLADAGHGMAARLADDVRWGGDRLGRAAGDGGRGSARTGLRRRVRRHRRRHGGPRRLGGRDHRALPQDARPGLHHAGRAAGVDLRARRLRGRAAVRVVPRRARRRRRGRRRPERLRRGHAEQALPLRRPL
ncbi:MAG: AIG2-like domain protein, partial [uncultured Nocardioidaceae bacterium]